MRIISGKFKGRKLASFKAEHIRPTSDRVKESMFNILQGYWEDARVLDLFSGTGNLAIEALSRGARQVEVVEMNPRSISIIKENLEILEIEKSVRIHRMDVMKFLKKFEGTAFEVILIDPPFTEKISHEVMEVLAQSKVYGEGTWILIESSAHEKIGDTYGDLVCVDRRDFGDKMISFFQKKAV